MTLVIIILIVVLLGIVLAIRATKSKSAEKRQCQSTDTCQTEDCGVSCFCDEKSMKRALETKIEYYEDEELDNYRGIPADQYTEEQVDEFNEVLTTLKQEEIADWLHSLELRGIELPNSLRDEVVMLLNSK